MGRALAGPQKGAARQGRTILWVDESGFYLLPATVRTYAPRGCPPILRVPLTNDHLSVISGITPSGRLLLRVQEHAFRSPDVVQFLRHLLRHLPGKLLVIWDGAPIHRGQPIKDFLAQGGAKRLRLEQLPGYAPDLNPDEGIWAYLKYIELRNMCAAPTWPTCTTTSAWPQLGSVTSAKSSAVVSPIAATPFRPSSGGV